MDRIDLPFRAATLDRYTHTNLRELPPRLRDLVQWTSDTMNPDIDKAGQEAARDELAKLRPAMHEVEWVETWRLWCADRKRQRQEAA